MRDISLLTRRGAWIAAASAPFAVSACATAQSSDSSSSDLVTAAVFSAWLDRYKAAWETRDAQGAGALFTENATYHEMPFDAPMEGRAAIEAYWARVTAGQDDIRFTYHVIMCEGDQGVAHWHAAFNAGGAPIELDGVFVCKFADASTVSSLREWWHVKAPAA